MTVTANLAAKLSVAFVAIAMAFSLVAPANAQESTADLQAEIDRLLEMISQLEGQMSGGGSTGGGSSADVCPYTWTRDLSSGSTGADVMALQQFLNSDPDTQVASAGQVGGPGMETDYYGPATGAAVAKFQMKYRSDILAPLDLVNPTQYFGAGSRGVANDLCVTPTEEPSLPGDGDDEGTDDGSEDVPGEGSDEEEEEEEEMELSGAADLDTMELDDVADDQIQEGRDDQPVAELEVEFEDGDARVSQMEFAFERSAGSNDADPWDTFENVSLWLDGDKIAEVAADDEDDWDETNSADFSDGEYVITMNGLDLVAEEDMTYDFIVGVSTQNGVIDDATGDTWEIDFEGDDVRYEDADGFVQEDNGTGDATFTVEEEGADDELDVRSSDADPESTTLILEDDEDTDAVAFAFDLDTEDSDNDIEIDEFQIDATVSSGTLLSKLVDDVRIIVDGDEVSTEDVTVNNSDILVEFDNNDFVIEAGDRVTVEVEFEFNALDTVEEGVRVEFSVDGSNIDAEGAEDLTGQSSHTGDEHTLITEGIVVNPDGVSVSEDTQGDNDTTGIFEIDFEVTAEEGDFYITENAAEASTTPTDGVAFSVDAPGVPTSVNGVLSSTADEDTSGVFTVDEGQTETFTLTVTIDASSTGNHRVTLDELIFSASTNGTSNPETRDLEPESDYRTGYENINAS